MPCVSQTERCPTRDERPPSADGRADTRWPGEPEGVSDPGPGNANRRAETRTRGQLFVTFSEDGRGRRVLRGFEYSNTGTDHGARREVTAARKLELRTPSGAGLGTTGAELERIYAGRVRAQRGSTTEFPPPSYVVVVSDRQLLFFIMDANGPQGRVVRIAAGGGCGE